jgi:3-(methylthio)propionyl---CoA ligase
LSPEEAIVACGAHVPYQRVVHSLCVLDGGAKLVLPGTKLDGASLYELIEAEKVTISAGVPTIWMALIQHLEQNNLRFSTMSEPLWVAPPCPPP